jgi:hypothetical protein
VFQNQIRKDSIVKTLNKAINPSLNTNPFNHNTNYIKLYDSVKEGTSDKDEYGQFINPRYLDDVFTFKTSLPVLTRYVRVNLGRAEYLVMKNVQVWDYSNVDRARGTGITATQSSTFSSEYALKAVDTDPNSYSHTNKELAWWEVDLGAEYTLKNVTILNRNDKWGNYGTRLTGGNVQLINNAGKEVGKYSITDGSPIEFVIPFGFDETTTVAAWKSPSPTGEPLLSEGCKTQLKTQFDKTNDLFDKSIALVFGNKTTIGQVCSFAKGLASNTVTTIPGFCCLDAPYQSKIEEWGEKVSSWDARTKKEDWYCDNSAKLTNRVFILKVLLPKVRSVV